MSEFDNISSIKSVQFNVLSADEIKTISVCEVNKPFSSNNIDLEGTLNDPRMGTTDNNKRCVTCKNVYKFCSGHSGHIVLKKPMFNIIYMKTICKILNCICYYCSELIIHPKDGDNNNNYLKILEINKKLSNMAKFTQIVKECSPSNITQCKYCGAPTYKHKYSKQTFTDITCTVKSTTSKNNELVVVSQPPILSPSDVYDILSKITDDNTKILGLNSRPESMILTYLLVLPPCVRPSVRSDIGKLSEDDLTHKYNDIIKCNNQNTDDKRSLRCLQYHIITLMDNKALSEQSVHKNGGRPLKSLKVRLSGKGGRFRLDIMGKRVDKSIRSVITADPTLSIDEVGIPYEICSNVTYPDIVTKFNIEYLTKLIRNGQVYPSVKSYVDNLTKKKINLVNTTETLRNNINLKYGDVVHRNLIKGDYVMFNRQPSLHKMSIMAHRVRPMPAKTLRSNPNICKPFNSDYDGDEMNVHVPQSILSVCELRFLMAVKYQIVSPQASKPVIVPVQDTILGAILLSESKEKFYDYDVNYLIKDINVYNYYHVHNDFKEKGYTNSSNIISGILPSVNYSDSKGKIVIKNGKITKGTFVNEVLKDCSGSLIHVIFNDCGSDAALNFINNIGRLAINFLNKNGFTCGYSDVKINKDLKDKIDNTIEDIVYKYDENNMKDKTTEQILKDCTLFEIIDLIKNGDERVIDFQDKELFFRITKNKLSTARSIVEKDIAEYFDKELNDNKFNGMYTMIKSGSKGKLNNMSQIVGLLSLQEVDGTWIENNLYRRTLPHFERDNINPEAHGFVRNSFTTGLNPTEYFFHSASGREGVYNKTITTADTGYIQRKFIKTLEDLRCCEDGTVRNANGAIIQMCYGNDGFDTTYHEQQKIEYINWSKSRLFSIYGYNDSDIKHYTNKEIGKDEMNEEFENIYNLCTYVKKTRFMNNTNLIVNSPINVKRIVETFVDRYNLNINAITDLTPVYVWKKVKHLLSKYVVCKNKDVNDDATVIIKLITSINLASRTILNYNFNIEVFEKLIEYIYSRFVFSIINPGENVGSICAQSLGQPTTQLSLNAFHNIGFEADGPAGGIASLQELMGLTKSRKFPMMKLVLNDGLTDNIRKIILNNLKEIKLSQIIIKHEIIFNKSDFKIYLKIYFDNNSIKRYGLSLENIFEVYKLISNEHELVNEGTNIYYIDKEGKNIKDTNGQDIFSSDNIPSNLAGFNFLIPEGIKVELKSYTNNENDINSNSIIDSYEILYDLVVNKPIKGVAGILDVKIDKSNKESYVDGEYIQQDDKRYKENESIKYEIKTIGSNFAITLVMLGIDAYESYTNDIWEMYAIFGIEVARKCIIKEYMQILGGDLNPINAMLLSDAMTNEGILVSCDRHGQNKTESGPIKRVTFEEPVPQLTSVAVHGNIDNMQGVSANVMFGQFFKSGTNYSSLVFDSNNKFKPIIPDEDTIEIIEDSIDYSIERTLEFEYIFYTKY